MASPGTLTSFSPNTLIQSAQVNTNFSTLRNSLLTAGFIDSANTWAISQAFGAGFTTSGTVTFTSGLTVASGTTVTASGVTIAGGFTIASGTTVTASGVTVAGNVLYAGTVSMSGALTVSGLASFQNSQHNGTPTFAGGVNCTALVSVTATLQMAAGNSIVCAAATLATNTLGGFLFIPTVPATSSGVPESFTGCVALVYETVGNHLLVYNGAWKSVALT